MRPLLQADDGSRLRHLEFRGPMQELGRTMEQDQAGTKVGAAHRFIHALRPWMIFPALACCMAATAQVPLTVKDADSGDPVPYAHVTWHQLGTETQGVAVAGPDGTCSVPWPAALPNDGVAVQVDFIGFTSLLDTLRAGAPRTVRLARAARFNLDELVVTGQYRPTLADKAVQRMHVIGAEQIQRMAAQNLGDVMAQELNMRLAQDNVLGTSLSMRGLGGENVKILVDGVPLIGRQDGNLDLAQIDLSGIERVEVLEGPLSVNYGTNALAGTINLISRKSTGNTPSLKAIAYTELIGRLNLSVAAGQRFGKSDLLITLGRNFFGGWRPGQGIAYDFSTNPADTTRYQPWKPREQYFGRINYRFAINPAWTLSYKGELMQDRITDRGRPRPPYLESAFDGEFLTQRVDNAFFAKGDLGRGRRLEGLVAYDVYDRTRHTWIRDLTSLEATPVPGEADDSRFTLTNVRFTYANAGDGARMGYELGTDINMETAEGERVADGTAQRIGDHALFASVQWRPVAWLIVRPGARYAYNTQYEAPLVPSLDARIQLDTALALRVSYAQGFRAPSLKELHLTFVDVNHDIQGNPDLAAEASNSYSLSLNWRKATDQGVLRGEVAASHDRVRNLITLAQESGTLYSYINVGEYRTLCGSAGLGWEAGPWTLGAGAALTGRYDTLGLASGAAAYDMAPEANLNVTHHWRKQGWSLTTFAKYTGEQRNYIYLADGSLGRGTIASFVMADASVAKQMWKERLTASVGCKNLFDITDLNATLGNGGAHSDASVGSLPLATGRTFFLRLALDLRGAPRTVNP
jgi:outer membrane receptor for ferrienterochelin and colicins